MSTPANDTVSAENSAPSEQESEKETEATTAERSTATFPADNRVAGHGCC